MAGHKEEAEKPKLSAKQVVKKVQEAGFPKFGMHQHTLCWKEHDAKNSGRGFGTRIVKAWYWYQHWPIFIISELQKTVAQENQTVDATPDIVDEKPTLVSG